MANPPNRPRGDCDTDDVWMVQPRDFVTMEVISEGQKGPLGFDLQKRKKPRKNKKAKKKGAKR